MCLHAALHASVFLEQGAARYISVFLYSPSVTVATSCSSCLRRSGIARENGSRNRHVTCAFSLWVTRSWCLVFILSTISNFSTCDSMANVDVVPLQMTVQSLVSFPIAVPGKRLAYSFSLVWSGP